MKNQFGYGKRLHKTGVACLPVTSMLLLILVGCAAPRGQAVPSGMYAKAVVPGFPDVRFYGTDSTVLIEEGKEALRREQAYLASQNHSGPLPRAAFLALSGGGDNGAFGAGLLNGWTAAGDRPTFKIVTGISTGALIAPFAFLGSKCDPILKENYTNVSAKDILKSRGAAGLFSDALADNAPLRQLLAKQINRSMLDEIAAEYTKGRLLFVGTTDLDARRGVIWNMTRIAASSDPRALDLFRNVLIASAAIPAAFPPMMIDVQVDGRTYQEMHVDGGTIAQVFVYPPSLNLKDVEKKAGVSRERKLYIIRNGRLEPEWAQAERKVLPIASRAISSLIDNEARGDLYSIYLLAHRDGVDYNLACIPADFNAPHREPFDTEYMRQLYDRAYQMASKGYPWEKVPPGFVQY